MKKICMTLLMACVAGLTALMAQVSTDRIIVRDGLGMTHGFLANRVDSIYFAQVEGEVYAKVTLYGVTEGANPVITLGVQRTPDCQAYSIAVFPPKASDYLNNDELAAYYISNYGSEVMYDDVDKAELSGFEEAFVPDAEYVVATVGYDIYGIPCGISKATFRTAKANIVGNPSVTATVTNTTKNSFTLKMVPNSDCMTYSFCSFDAGTIEEEFAKWKAGFGLNSISEMITFFCQGEYSGTKTQTWNKMNPGNDYEVWISLKDINGNYADPICVPVATKPQGGEGVAEVAITIKGFEYNDEAKVYLQTVRFAPNDQTWLYRAMLIEKEAFDNDWTEEKLLDYLKDDERAKEDMFWNLYSVDEGPWTVKPATDYVAYAIAKNIKGEWGPLAVKEFTTPAGYGMPARPAKAPARQAIEKSEPTGPAPLRLPATAKAAKLQLAPRK